ncbi:MAG: YgiT-type zinc finger protein [Pseudomonadota bacterium]
MTCEFCGGETTRRKVKRQHWLNGKLFIVENVEAEVCLECGERYFHAVILDEVDRFLLAQHNVKERIDVEVVIM